MTCASLTVGQWSDHSDNAALRIAEHRLATGDGEWHPMVWWHWWESAGLDEAGTVAQFQADEPPNQWLDWTAHQIWPNAAFDGRGAHRLIEHRIGVAR